MWCLLPAVRFEARPWEAVTDIAIEPFHDQVVDKGAVIGQEWTDTWDECESER